MNSDGKIDLLITAGYGVDINVFPGNGDGTFGPAYATSVQTDFPFVPADFNADGLIDVAIIGAVYTQIP